MPVRISPSRNLYRVIPSPSPASSIVRPIVLLDSLGQATQEARDERSLERACVAPPAAGLLSAREGVLLRLPVAMDDPQLGQDDAPDMLFGESDAPVMPHVASFSSVRRSPQIVTRLRSR